MTFSETPIEPHTPAPSEASSRTRVTAPVPLVSSRIRTLKLTRSMSARCGMDLHQGVAQGPVEGVHRAVSLRRSHVALTIDPDLDRRLGLDPAIGPLLHDRPPGLEPEQRLVFTGLLAQQQLEGPVRRLEVVAMVLELLDALDHLGGLSVVQVDPGVGGTASGRFPCPDSSETSTSRALPTTAGSMCSNVAGSAATPATCIPPLWANALRPT